MGILARKISWNITTTQINLALHPSGVAKLSTSFSWSKGGKVTAAGWQVTLCDPIKLVISCSGEVISTNRYISFTYLLQAGLQTKGLLCTVSWTLCPVVY